MVGGKSMTLDPQAQAFLEKRAALKLPDISELGIAARYGGHEENDWGGPLGNGAIISHRFITTPTADVPVRIYTPKNPETHRAFVFFHGGGWVLGHIDKYDPQMVDIAQKTNSVVVSVNYQKSPEHKFPIPHDDCFAALQWVLDNADVLNIDPAKIGVGGDSAGGNLAAGVALRARDEKIALAYQLLIYPATKLDFDTPSYLKNAEGYGLRRRGMMWFWDQYLHPDDKSNPYAVPDVESDHTNLATAIIPTAEYDVLRDDGLSYAAKLEAAGNKVISQDFAGQIHGFFSHSKFVDASYALRSWLIEQINLVLD
jgi:acetyl esterase